MAISAFSSVKTRCEMTGTVTRTVSGLTNSISGAINSTTTNLLSTKPWSYGTGVDSGNQILTTAVSIAASGTNSFDLSGALTNIAGDSSATLSAVKAIMVELLTSAQDSTNGTACSSITIGADATNPWLAPFDAGTGTYTIKSGGRWFHEDPTAAGLAVTAGTGDILQIVNNDGAVAAYVRITILGLS